MSDLLPSNAPQEMRDMSLAMAREIPVPIITIKRPYECPSHLLPWLAWELSVDEWDASAPETNQRQAIAASIAQHRIKGTVGAVKAALVRGLGRTVEIDEQTGTPYTFRIRVQLLEGESSGGAVATEMLERAKRIVERTKNARSELIGQSYYSETAPGPIYYAGAVATGAEVEIKGAPTPLPLDGRRNFLLGAFWTVRMTTEYAGPIGRAIRDSDSAVLDYYTVEELADFVSGTTWRFVQLYDQGGSNLIAKASQENHEGTFDADGLPCATAYEVPTLDTFTATLPNSSYAATSAIVGGASEDYEVYPSCRMGRMVIIRRDDSGSGNYVTVDNTSTLGAWRAGDPAGQSGATGARIGSGSTSIQDGAGTTNNTTAGDRTSVVGKLAMFIRASNYEPSGPRLYGGAFWGVDIGETAMSTIIQDINARLNP